MKRALPGKNRKQATPARKPATRRPTLRTKSKPAIPAARRRSAGKKTKATTPLKTAIPKVARRKAGKIIRQPKLALPAFLLEGDEPGPPAGNWPGEKFALGPTPPLDHFDEAKAPLPESYGTGRLFLTARDPHWLYAHWDFTMQEQFHHNARSVDRHMVLRLHDAGQPGPHLSEVHVHPESRHWFTHVDDAGKKYFAEIGYYLAGRKWKSLAISEPQRTPPDDISPDATPQFATIPLELSFETMLALLRESAAGSPEQNLPLARALENIRTRPRPDFPEAMYIADWTPEQEQALAAILVADRAGLAPPSSQDSVRGQSAPNAEAAVGAPPSSYVSSFFGGAGQKDFWFNVNAELIVYGATAPNATVTFAGKPIPLRPDGSFRFHFALPDGRYELPVTAVSPDGTDGRAAALKFTRATEIRGHVEAHPQAPASSPPPGDSA